MFCILSGEISFQRKAVPSRQLSVTAPRAVRAHHALHPVQRVDRTYCVPRNATGPLKFRK